MRCGVDSGAGWGAKPDDQAGLQSLRWAVASATSTPHRLISTATTQVLPQTFKKWDQAARQKEQETRHSEVVSDDVAKN